MLPGSETLLARAALVAGISLFSMCGFSSCVSFTWSRHRMYQPLPKNAIVGLDPGSTKLDACIERLGAPLYVWEYKGDGAALAWGRGDAKSKRISVSIPVKAASPSVTYADVDATVRGVVLLFDKDLVLEQVKQGYLRAIAREVAKTTRPAPVEAPAANQNPAPNPNPGQNQDSGQNPNPGQNSNSDPKPPQ